MPHYEVRIKLDYGIGVEADNPEDAIQKAYAEFDGDMGDEPVRRATLLNDEEVIEVEQ